MQKLPDRWRKTACTINTAATIGVLNSSVVLLSRDRIRKFCPLCATATMRREGHVHIKRSSHASCDGELLALRILLLQ